MSLTKAVLAVADNIEEDAKRFHSQDVSLCMLLNAYARQIRAAVTASESTEFPERRAPSRQQNEQINQLADREERLNSGMAIASGGNSDGDYVPIDPAMPLRAKTLVAGQVYVLTEPHTLTFSAEETAKLVAGKTEPVAGIIVAT